MRDAAVHLAVGDERVDERPGVVDRDDAQRARPCPSPCRPRRRRGERRTGRSARAWNSCATFSSPSLPSAPALGASSAHESAGSGRAGDVEAAAVRVEHDVVGARLEVVGRELLRLLDDLVGRQPRRRAADLGRLRAVRAGALRRLVGVALDDGDRSTGRPSRSAAIIAKRGLVALAVRERAGAHDRAAVRGDLDLAELRLGDAGW